MKLKLMTYNIAATRDFGKGTGKPFEYSVEKYAETIKEQAPDICGLNEVDYMLVRSGRIKTTQVLGDLIGYENAFAPAVTWLYGGKPGDDATACIVKVRRREPMNILFGPPSNRDDCTRMMSLFFSKEGKHIICGGTTSSIAAKYLGKPIRASLNYERSDVPPTAEIEGVDLVTEGVITINKVLDYAKDYLSENKFYEEWNFKRDGASMICRLLFEEATDINFFVGRAINPAHQNPDLPINFNIKMSLVEELSKCLRQMGKRIKVSYF